MTKLYKDMKLFGPYLRKDGRQIVVLVGKSARTTVSYPKYIIELHLGRYLEVNETVDHIDRNPLNNDLQNLQVLTRSIHSAKDVKKYVDASLTCPNCEKQFTLKAKQVHDAKNNRRNNRVGPFCSRSCAGKYSASVRYGNGTKLKVELLEHLVPVRD